MSQFTSPYAQAMGFGTSRDEDDRPLLTMAFETNKMGRPNFLHGGAIAGMLEVIAYQTLAEALGDEDRPQLKPINVTVNFLRGGRDHMTFARATITRLGRRIANIEAIAWQDDPTKPIATAQMNIMLDRG